MAVLEERARAGLCVHAHIDGFGSLGLPDAARLRMRDAHLRLAVFNPLPPWGQRWAWSVRDHRKFLVAYGAVDRRFDADIEQRVEIEPSRWARRGVVRRLIERNFHAFRRWL